MEPVRQLAATLSQARRLLVLTGAGVSAESGIATFRDAQTGLWARFRPEDLATPEAFARDPALVWRWYAWRRDQIARAQPNAAHYALVEIARRLPTTLVTQNVDDLHQRAGFHDAICLHGSIARTLCSITGQAIDADWLAAHPQEPPPSPHHPRGLARPGVVWFGENLPAAALEQAYAAAADCDVVLAIGTSALVHPAAGLPAEAQRHGAWFAEINPQRTPLSGQADLCLPLAAGVALPAVLAAWNGVHA
ncbi:NAD-dependent deacetylase [Tahibacter aquaticus]|uniref:NAD-dependent protein deacylase n=1 Tax=Tahibacter aquaticus TaxID=520092 RepID=A0A4R6YYZ1_9GAMM|nr:NAD-dependent deacylase [Tahibacter aquaticus]TDR44108.1 NAD-dependent deacetylase [Tahibacter aquaticus]